MIEIYADIPQKTRDQAKFWVDMALRQKDLFEGIRMVSEYARSCESEEEKEFVDFYFKLRLEALKNGSISNLG